MCFKIARVKKGRLFFWYQHHVHSISPGICFCPIRLWPAASFVPVSHIPVEINRALVVFLWHICNWRRFLLLLLLPYLLQGLENNLQRFFGSNINKMKQDPYWGKTDTDLLFAFPSQCPHELCLKLCCCSRSLTLPACRQPWAPLWNAV